MGWLRKLLGKELVSDKTNCVRVAVDDINSRMSQIKKAGSVDGVHYTDSVEKIKELKRLGRHDEAIELLLQTVNSTEKESKAGGKGWGVAPWYYEQLAIIYRKEKRYAEEVSILERYEAQPKAPGVGPVKLAERLIRARLLVSKSS